MGNQSHLIETIGPDLHVAAIMDGNGRWATSRGLERTAGHAAGEDAITAIVTAAERYRVAELSLFAFSTENWNRPVAEVEFLMRFNGRLIDRHGQDYHDRNIRVRYLGEREAIPDDVRRKIGWIEELTGANSGLKLNFAFNHGGRAELATAVRSIVREAPDPSDITESTIQAHLQFSDIPDVDLLIRTSGEYRISNFMLWRLAYAELVFLDVYWPDFRDEHLAEALRIYETRTRRFGEISPEPHLAIAAAVGDQG
jgi:undecaprenyl diphosphate synthase